MAEIPLADFLEAYANRKAGKTLSGDIVKEIRKCSGRAEVRAILAQKPTPASKPKVKSSEKNGKKQESKSDKKIKE